MTSELVLDKKLISSKYFIVFFLFQLALIVSIYSRCYVIPGLFLLGILSIFIFHDLRRGLFFVFLLIIFSRSIAFMTAGSRVVHISFDYLILFLLLLAWFLKKIFSPKDNIAKVSFFYPFFWLIIFSFISLINAFLKLGFIKSLDGIILLFISVEYGLLFMLLPEQIRSSRNIKGMTFFMLWIAAITALIGFYQFFVLKMPRISSIFQDYGGSANLFGAFLTIFSLLALSLSFSLKDKEKTWFFILFIIFTINLIFTFSRGAWIGFLFGFIFILAHKGWKRKFLLFILILPFLMVVTQKDVFRRWNTIAKVTSDQELINRFTNIDYRLIETGFVEKKGFMGYKPEIVSAGLRFSAWKEAINIFKESPLLGCGLSLNRYFGRMAYAENLYLDILAGMGILGFIVFLWMILKLYNFARETMRRAKEDIFRHFVLGYLASLVAIAFISLSGSVMFNPKLQGVFWFLTGLTISINRLETREERK